MKNSLNMAMAETDSSDKTDLSRDLITSYKFLALQYNLQER